MRPLDGHCSGAPVVYRGLEVGKVVHVGLSKDGASVKVTAVVDSEYGELVRKDPSGGPLADFASMLD